MRLQLSLLTSICLFVTCVRADGIAREARPSAAPVQELKKISVTATRGPREVDSIAGTVTIIDESQIQAQMVNDIKDLVRYEPGVSVANSSNRFGLAGFNIRGIEGNRVLLRVDGVRMADAFSIGSFSDARRNLIDLDAVKSVEIIRGAASALYGSAAIGGVVSFVMKEPADYLVEGRRTHFAAKSGYQSDDDGWYTGATVALGDERASALLLYTHRDGHETDNQGNVASADRTRTQPNPQDYRSDSLLAKFNWSPADGRSSSLTVEADRGEVATDVFSGVGVQGTANTQSLAGDDEQRRTRISLGQEIFADTALFESLQWQLYGQRSEVEQRTHERRFAVAAGPAAAVRRDRTFTLDQEMQGAELILHKEFDVAGTQHRFTYGLDVIHTRTEQLRNGVQTAAASGAQTSSIPPDNFPVRDFPSTDTWEYALYAQDEIGLADGKWLLVPGVRADRYELDPEPDATFNADNPGVTPQELHETSIAPKLGVIRAFGEQLSVFAQYARGFRAPPYNDVNIGFTNLAFGYTAIPNPDLEPETSNGYELGLRGDFDASFFALTGFYNDYDDFIESLASVGTRDGLLVFQSRNLAEARIYGAELKAGFDLAALSQSFAGWRLKTSVAWARGEDRVTDQPLNSVDPLKGVLGIAYQPAGGRWGVQLVGTAVERKSRVNESSGALFVPAGYVTLDLLAHADIGERLRIHAGVFNLADRKYWEWPDVRGRPASDAAIDRYTRPGINASASATFRF